MIKNFLPIVLIIIDLSQSIICLWQRDYARAIYWLSAGLLTGTTIFMH